MVNDRRIVLALFASLGLGAAAACGGSSTGPLNTASVVTDTITLTDSMYDDSIWNVPVGSGPFAPFNARVATIIAPEITQAIAVNGLVLVYVNADTSADSTDEWMPLPFSVGTLYLQTFTYAYAPGVVKVGFYLSPTDATFGTPNVYGLTVPTERFKIVIGSGSAGEGLAERRESP